MGDEAQTRNSEFTVLKIFREQHIDDHNLIRLWLVKWNLADAPVLEKRRIWIDRHGAENTRRLMGLTLDDVNYVVEHQQEISRILQGALE